MKLTRLVVFAAILLSLVRLAAAEEPQLHAPLNEKEMRQLEANWERALASYVPLEPRGKPTAADQKNAPNLCKLIGQTMSPDSHYALMLQMSASEGPAGASSKFVKRACDAFFEMYALDRETSDRSALATLLSRRVFDRVEGDIGHVDFGRDGKSPGLPNGLMVLCDAYDQAADGKVRRSLAKALRRGFAPYVVEKDDAKLVAACRTWYREHHEEFTFNYARGIPSKPPRAVGDPPEDDSLIVPRKPLE